MDWGSCSVTSGYGIRWRQRGCNLASPGCDGLSGSDNEAGYGGPGLPDGERSEWGLAGFPTNEFFSLRRLSSKSFGSLQIEKH